jgi:hypothetical protein
MIAEKFYEDIASNNKNKPSETDATKGKTEEKVITKKNHCKIFLQTFFRLKNLRI